MLLIKKRETSMKKIIIFILMITLFMTITACQEAEQENQNEQASEQAEQNEQARVYEILEENITVGAGTAWALNGLLTLPKDADGKVPAVVLVHGSGPSDMDGTPPLPEFVNTPFRDIAEYLSSKGIAVIRYDKRGYAHGLKMIQQFAGSFTVYEETIEDAILAAHILRTDRRINSDKVFILGHSMGGMLAPRIHAEGGNFAGIISLAGSPRSLIEIAKDQNIAISISYIETLDGEEKEEFLKAMETFEDDWADFWNAFLDLPDDEAKNTMVPNWGNTSAYYWKDLQRNPTSKYVQDINIPFLIMQGSADFQASADIDFVAWQELLAGRQNATFKLYDGLNHLLMTSTTGDLDEYKVAGHVDGQVLQDIVDWIKAN